MTSSELFELTLALKIVLWVEAIVYLGLGIFEIFDDFGTVERFLEDTLSLKSHMGPKEPYVVLLT